jgi:hypothetical protein
MVSSSPIIHVDKCTGLVRWRTQGAQSEQGTQEGGFSAAGCTSDQVDTSSFELKRINEAKPLVSQADPEGFNVKAWNFVHFSNSLAKAGGESHFRPLIKDPKKTFLKNLFLEGLKK